MRFAVRRRAGDVAVLVQNFANTGRDLPCKQRAHFAAMTEEHRLSSYTVLHVLTAARLTRHELHLATERTFFFFFFFFFFFSSFIRSARTPLQSSGAVSVKVEVAGPSWVIVQELCESRGGRPGLSVLTSLLVSVDVKNYRTVLRHWSQLVPNMSTDI